jgi:hypothetical protein
VAPVQFSVTDTELARVSVPAGDYLVFAKLLVDPVAGPGGAGSASCQIYWTIGTAISGALDKQNVSLISHPVSVALLGFVSSGASQISLRCKTTGGSAVAVWVELVALPVSSLTATP